MSDKKITLDQLFEEINAKIQSGEEGSYSRALALGGVEKITRKVGEEALEVVIAAFLDEKEKSEKTHKELIGEVCDLFYHTLVLLAEREVKMDEILQELSDRNNK